MCSARYMAAKNWIVYLNLDLNWDANGVNNRDLKTFEVRLEVSLNLAGLLPSAAEVSPINGSRRVSA